MTRSFYFIIFSCLFILGFSIYSYRVQADSTYEMQSTEYENHLTRACQSAVAAQQKRADGTGIYLFDTAEKREQAVEQFFATLERGFNYVNDSNSAQNLRYHVPVLCLVDNDGYYLAYNEPYEDANGSLSLVSTISTLNTWGTEGTNGQYYVRFFLSDYVEVTDNRTGLVKNGPFYSVYKTLGQPEALEILSTREKFENEKIDIIISTVNEVVEEYINQYNFRVNRISQTGSRTDFDIHYSFELPKVSYEDWCNLLDEPSALALLQGMQINNGDRYLNIYAMSGGEMVKNKGYVKNTVNGVLTYHRMGCPLGPSVSTDYSMTKEECAKQGAFPCEECCP